MEELFILKIFSTFEAIIIALGVAWINRDKFKRKE